MVKKKIEKMKIKSRTKQVYEYHSFYSHSKFFKYQLHHSQYYRFFIHNITWKYYHHSIHYQHHFPLELLFRRPSSYSMLYDTLLANPHILSLNFLSSNVPIYSICNYPYTLCSSFSPSFSLVRRKGLNFMIFLGSLLEESFRWWPND